MRRFTVIAAVALLGLAACSDDNSSSATTAITAGSSATEPVETAVDETVVDETVVDETVVDETVVDETVVDDTVVDDTVVDETADPNAPGAGSEFCEISDELNANDFDPFAATPGEVEEFFTVSFPDMFSRLGAAAPAELDDDIATLGAAYALLTTELENNGWDFNAAFNPAVQDAISGEEFFAAGANLDAYCGLAQ